MNEPTLQSDYHSLCAILDIQVVQNHADMTFDRGLGDTQLKGDRLVALPLGQQGQDLLFAFTQHSVRDAPV